MDFTRSPIRILDGICQDFWISNPIIRNAIDEYHLSINFVADKFIRPEIHLDTGEIILSLPYMDYIWYFCFAFFVKQELINKKLIELRETNTDYDYTINLTETEEGKQVQKCLLQCDQILHLQDIPIPQTLLIDFSTNITSPDNNTLSDSIKYYQEKVNNLYVRALTCTLLHEIGHAVHKHNEITNPTDDIKKTCETEADNFAFDSLIQGSPAEVLNNSFGALLSFMSMYFEDKKSTHLHSITHPMTHDRCNRCIKRFQDANVEKKGIDYLYHMASQVAMEFLNNRGVAIDNLNVGNDAEGYYHQLLDTVDSVYL